MRLAQCRDLRGDLRGHILERLHNLLNCVFPLLAAILAPAACDAPGPASVVLSPGLSFAVAQIDGYPAPAGVTLEVVEPKRLAGQGPCNTWFAGFDQDAVTLRIGSAGATRMACLDNTRKSAEESFFIALQSVDAIVEGLNGEVLMTQGGQTRITLMRSR